MWYLAGEALRLTDRLVCIGYSLPITDLSIQFFLADNHASEKIPLIIVNKDPGAEARYKELVGSSYEVEQPFSGPDAVQQFVKTLD